MTPSRHPEAVQNAIIAEVDAGCRALGLAHGPIHAEVRLTTSGPRILEVAPRSIGGQCSRVFTWALGTSLERLIYRHALGLDLPTETSVFPAGVLMLPVPTRGVLRGVQYESAMKLEGVEAISITHERGEAIPLPEGQKYLGFVFARGDSAAAVERTLRKAQDHIIVDIVSDGGLLPR